MTGHRRCLFITITVWQNLGVLEDRFYDINKRRRAAQTESLNRSSGIFRITNQTHRDNVHGHQGRVQPVVQSTQW